MNHSHEYGTRIIPLMRKTHVTESVSDELQALKVDGFTQGESNVGQVVAVGNDNEFQWMNQQNVQRKARYKGLFVSASQLAFPAEKLKVGINNFFQWAFRTLKSKLQKKWTKNWKAHLKLLFKLLVCKKAKCILQKPTPKIKQLDIQLAMSQLFQKLKSRSINKQGLNPPS
jgi:hypothetical protein